MRLRKRIRRALEAAVRSSDPSSRPGTPAVYRRIAALTDCAALQKEFDTAEANGARERAAGRTKQASWATSYMRAADERMKQLGCYE